MGKKSANDGVHYCNINSLLLRKLIDTLAGNRYTNDFDNFIEYFISNQECFNSK